jgi:hypothetical protein
MIDVEPLIEASFDRMLPTPVVAADWGDVLRRAGVRTTRRFRVVGTTRRRLVVVALALMALVVVVAAAAYALGHPVVRFGGAPRATSRTVVDEFGQWTVLAVPTPVRPHQARLITTVSIGGHRYPLFVAPVRGGGFCYFWKHSFSSCEPGGKRGVFGGVQVSGADTQYRGREYLSVINGVVSQARAAHVVLHYADGQSADIPFVWVTAPIRSGFFLYSIPPAHQRPGHQPVRIALTNVSGAVIASQRLYAGLPIPKPPRRPYRLVPHRLAGYPLMNVPAPAIWTKRQQLFGARTTTGTHIGLWIASARGGGTCYWSNLHAGCGKLVPATLAIPKLRWNSKLGAYEAVKSPTPHYWLEVTRDRGYVALCCTLDPRTRRVELRFQGGDHVTLTSRSGYLMWPIPPRDYPPGHRLEEVDLYGPHGSQIGAKTFDPAVRALYPCRRPKNYGYGLKVCP